MKAILKLSLGCLTLTAALQAAPTLASPQAVVGATMAVVCSVGQTSDDADSRRKADDWLRQARKAIKDGDLELANYYVERAEKLNVKYDRLFAPLVDTPEKVRRDLDELRANNDRSPQPPSRRYSPGSSTASAAGSQSPPNDPFAARASERGFDTIPAPSRATAQQADPGRLVRPASASSSALELRPSDVTAKDLDRLPPVAGSPDNLHKSPFGNSLLTNPDEVDASRDPLSENQITRAGAVAGGPSRLAAKAEALRLTALARAALDRGELVTARGLAEQAHRLGVPDTAFAQHETRPWELLLDVQSAINRRHSGALRSTQFELPEALGAAPEHGDRYPVMQGLYDPNRDPTRTIHAQALNTPTPASPAEGFQLHGSSPGLQLFRRGMQALETHDRETALQYFKQAWQYRAELEPGLQQELKDKLSALAAAASDPMDARRPPSPLEEASAQQELLRQKLFREIATEQQEAERESATNPFRALERLQKLRQRVVQAEADPAASKQLLTLVDRSIRRLESFIDQNRADLELNERNRAILGEIDRRRQNTIEIQDQIAALVEKFNTFVDEERFAEAEVIAKQVRELDPESPIARTLTWKSRALSRNQEQNWIRDLSEQGFHAAMISVERSKIPFNDEQPIDFGDVTRWKEISNLRGKWAEQQRRRLTPVEIEIQQALTKPVEVRFTDRPLKEVLDTLGSMVGVNIYADPQGLAAEGVTTDSPVTINLTRAISLRSALNLVLQPLRLSYVIQDEVLLVTSEQSRDAKVLPHVYYVADLVIPIPNFVPSYNIGLPAAIREAHQALGYGGVVQPVSMAPLTVAANETSRAASPNRSVLAQMSQSGLLPSGGGRPPQQLGYGPGSMGGAAFADFDTLIELIKSTIAPETWDDVGGPGAIEEFPTNLSLVISTTQDVHDQIADLLEQLRRLQDLQVTIEVRFITLQDDFFERLGVDFDFDIDDNVLNLPFDDSGPSVSFGLDRSGNPTADLDFSFTQDSFGLTAPAFGGFQPQNAASFGFAILSDIEAFFLLEAAQGDERSNVLQAPKVTLFNGQLASVSDTSARPFVTSLIPVVGDFAAAHQPVIVVLNEGTSLSVQAVVSSDRRFVRLTLVPFFSRIGDVEEFTFHGTTTSNTGSNVLDPDGKPTGSVDNVQTTTSGTTVQLPTFSFTTVSTTVSVPDGGTILLGGIKRLREARNEQGVPMLSKLPYVNRLFRNVGIGRETQSLMLMVTPRIIIQEEEEEKLGIE